MKTPTIVPAALALACAGFCAVPAFAQADPGQWVAAPEGSVFVYHRQSTGSYGVYDGPVSWTVGRRDWNGQPLTSWASTTHGAQLLDPKTHGVVVQLNRKGDPSYTYDPPIALDWPLAVGKSWTSVHQMTIHTQTAPYAPAGSSPLTMQFKVEALEDVTVPAGTFKAYKVVQTTSFGEVDQVWSAPAQGIATVKRIADRPASHPLGAGHLEALLTSRATPPH